MNVLKKAFLLISLMLGMLLLSSHTTNNIFDTGDDDDFAIVLRSGDPRSGCNEFFSVNINDDAPLASSMRITVVAAQQMNFQVLHVMDVTNPYMYLGIDSYQFNLPGLYNELSPGWHNIIFMVEINNSNGSHTLYNDDKLVHDNSCK